MTAEGAPIGGDLFLDCSDSGVLVATGGARPGWVDWSEWLPCDRMLIARCDGAPAPAPYSYAEATPAGWIRHLPLRGETWLTYFYAADRISAADAEAALTARACAAGLRDTAAGALRCGRLAEPWRGNCVTLGRAAARIDPVGIGNLQLWRLMLDRLLQLLPGGSECAAEAAEYNRQVNGLLDGARDFAALHYRLNGRRGEPFWDAARETALPGPLAHRLRLYEHCGRIVQYDQEPLADASWVNLFDEHGVLPRHVSRIAAGADVARLDTHVTRIREVMIDALQAKPTYADFLRRFEGAASER